MEDYREVEPSGMVYEKWGPEHKKVELLLKLGDDALKGMPPQDVYAGKNSKQLFIEYVPHLEELRKVLAEIDGFSPYENFAFGTKEMENETRDFKVLKNAYDDGVKYLEFLHKAMEKAEADSKKI